MQMFSCCIWDPLHCASAVGLVAQSRSISYVMQAFLLDTAVYHQQNTVTLRAVVMRMHK